MQVNKGNLMEKEITKPNNLKECCLALDKLIPAKEIKRIKAFHHYDEMSIYHISYGLYIRNNWLNNEELLKNLGYSFGVFMRDHVSGEILEYYWFYIHGLITDENESIDDLIANYDK